MKRGLVGMGFPITKIENKTIMVQAKWHHSLSGGSGPRDCGGSRGR